MTADPGDQEHDQVQGQVRDHRDRDHDTITVVTTPQNGENGFTNWGQQNPFNDVLVEEPSYGSSNGILELEGTATPPCRPLGQTIDHATRSPVRSTCRRSTLPARPGRRSSTSSGDYQGLNFVAYAEDAVSYLTGPSTTAPPPTPRSASLRSANNPTTARAQDRLQRDVHRRRAERDVGQRLRLHHRPEPEPDLRLLGAERLGHRVDVGDRHGRSLPGPASSNWPAKQIIFENETTSILGNAAAAPVGDVMFFFSYGKLQQGLHAEHRAPTTASTTLCAERALTTTPNQVELGTEAERCRRSTETTINNQLPGQTGSAFFG